MWRCCWTRTLERNLTRDLSRFLCEICRDSFVFLFVKIYSLGIEVTPPVIMEVLKKRETRKQMKLSCVCWIGYNAQTSRKETTSVILPLVYLRNILSYLQQGGRTFEAVWEKRSPKLFQWRFCFTLSVTEGHEEQLLKNFLSNLSVKSLNWPSVVSSVKCCSLSFHSQFFVSSVFPSC